MECYACYRACPSGAISLAESDTCTRLLGGGAPLSIDPDACTDCGACDKVCLLGDPARSAESCSFCLVCSGRSRCIVPGEERATLGNALASVARLVALLPRYFS